MALQSASRPADQEAAEQRPWKEALLWLLLVPGFLLAYIGAEYYTSVLPPNRIGEIGMAWEHVIPFWPWTILLYLSIDVMYAVSPFVCRTRGELRTHVPRFIVASLVSVICFLLFPLHFDTARPPVNGVPGALFALLGLVDRPFNQAPSLHIGMLVILWACFRPHCPKPWRWLLHLGFFLIACSVLTTWQHHFLDVPLGLLLGAAVCGVVRQQDAQQLARIAHFSSVGVGWWRRLSKC